MGPSKLLALVIVVSALAAGALFFQQRSSVGEARTEDRPALETGSSERAPEASAPVALEPASTAGGREPLLALPRLRSSSGEVIAGGRIARIPLPRDRGDWPAQARMQPLAIDWAAVRAGTSAVVTAADGSFAPPTAAEGQAGPAVYWCEHEAHAALAVLQLDPDLPVDAWPELEPAAPFAVRAIGLDGRPAVGAEVQVFHARAGIDAVADQPELALALRLFGRDAVTDGEGRAAIAFSDHPAVARAAFQGTVSDWMPLARSAETELRLRECFTLRAQVTSLDGTEPGPDARLLAWSERGASRQLAAQPIRSLGGQSALAVPLAQAELLIVALEGSGFVGRRRELPMPAAGAALELRFELEAALELPLLARTDEGTPVPGAAVALTWGDDVSVPRGQASAVTDAQGRATIAGPREGQAHVSASARGYQESSGGLWLPFEDPDELIELIMSPGAIVRGQVLFAGEPLEGDCQVSYWPIHHPGGPRKVSTTAGGRFEITDCPLGQVNLLAFAHDHPQSSTLTLEIEAEGRDGVELELPAPIRARGRVLDLLSGEPIEAATIQLCTSTQGRLINLVGPVATTDSDGRFEMGQVNPDVLGIGIQKAGFGDHWATRLDMTGPVAELGLFALAPKRDLVVRLEHDGSVDPTQYRTWMQWGVTTSPIPFGADGVARIADVPMGSPVVFVEGPDDASFAQHVLLSELPPDAPWESVFRISAGTFRLRIETGGHFDPSVIGAAAKFFAAPSCRQTVQARTAIDGEDIVATFAAVPAAGELGVTVYDEDDFIGAGVWSLERTREAVLKLDPEWLVVELLDEDGEPVSNVDIVVTKPESSGGWQMDAKSDSQGRARFGIGGLERVLVHVLDRSAGSKHGRLVDMTSGERLVRIELDDLADLELVLRDGDEPLMGLRSLLLHPSHSITLNEGFSDHEGRTSFPRVALDTYRLRLDHPSVWPVDELVEHTSPGTPRPIQVRRRADLELTLQSSDGLPRAHLPLALTALEHGTPVEAWLADGRVAGPASLVTDARGRLVLQGLPRGPYHLAVATPEGLLIDETLDLAPGPNTLTRSLH